MATTKKTASNKENKATTAKTAVKKAAAPKKTVATKKTTAPKEKEEVKKTTTAKVNTTKADVANKQKSITKDKSETKLIKEENNDMSKAAAKKAAVKKTAVKKTVALPKEEKATAPKKEEKLTEAAAKKAAAKKAAAKKRARKAAEQLVDVIPKLEIRDAIQSKSTVKKSKPGVIARPRLKNEPVKTEQPETTMKEYNPTKRSLLDGPEESTGPIFRYSDDDLIEFRELINKRLESARENHAYYQALITRKDEGGTDDTDNRFNHAEDGSGAMEREQLAQLAARQLQFIDHLEKAMIRIENKTYGVCRVTGKLIDKARLRAVPHATLSIEAKNSMNN